MGIEIRPFHKNNLKYKINAVDRGSNAMENNTLNIRNVLELIFKTTKKKGNILADCYLIKNSSIISKWKNSRSKPSIEDLAKIVEFAYKESSEMQRKIIRNEIECLVINSSLKENMKNSLLRISGFKEFLSEVLNVVTAGKENLQDSSTVLKSDSLIKLDKPNNINELDDFKPFLGDKEGKYAGELEFDLILSNDKGEKSKIRYSGMGNFRIGLMSEDVKKKVGYASALGVIFVLVVAGLFSINAGSRSQAKDKKVIVENENGTEQKAIDNKVLEMQRPEIEEEIIGVSESEDADKLPVETNTKVDNTKTHQEVVCDTPNLEKDKNDQEKENPKQSDSEANQKDTDKGVKKNNPTKTDNTNSSSINENTKTNAITDNSIVIEDSPFVGNDNVIGLGSNIYINIQD